MIIFRVNFNNAVVNENFKRLHGIPTLPDITSETFFKVFPFCILIDPSMHISHTGKSIKTLFPADTVINGRYIDEIFRLIRPDITLEWNKVIHSLIIAENCVMRRGIFSYLIMVDILSFSWKVEFHFDPIEIIDPRRILK